MARSPVVVTCDICGVEIRDAQIVRMSIPLPAGLQQQIRASLESRMPRSILGLALIGAVPSHWTLEACPCVLGLLPMLADIVADSVRKTIDTSNAAGLVSTHRDED